MSLAEIAGGRGTAVCGVSISFPGSTQRFATAPYSSASGGQYAGKILGWSRIGYALSDRSGRLPSVETSIRVSDTDRTIARIVSGVNADTVRGSAATAYIMAPGTASSSWKTIFSGSVVKVSFPEPFVAEITLRVNDDAVQRLSPRGGWVLTRVAWPNAKAEVFDKVAPILYGQHDASGMQTGPGLIPTLYVDTIEFRYLVCAGKAKSIDRVYVDDVQTGSGWSTEYVTRSGRIYTCINFTTDQGTAEITADVQGYEDVGDGSGTLITNPATQWAHRMSNFVLGDYMTGSWLSTNSLIDSTALSAAEDYLDLLSARGSYYSALRQTGHDIIAKFCHSWRMRSWWTLTGTIAIGYENIFAQPYTGTRFQWTKQELGRFNLAEDDWNVTSRITVRQALSSSQGSYLATFEVQDASVSSDTQDALDLQWSEAK